MKLVLLFTLISLSGLQVVAQEKATLSGNIRDKSDGEDIIGAKIKVKDQSVGAVTNEYGFYSLTLPKGTYTIVFSFPAYKEIEEQIVLDQDITKDISLELLSTIKEIKEVEITGVKPDQNVKDPLMGVERLDPKELAKLPVIFGEKDIIKTMQLLPGVKSAGEGGSGFYVRGGAADQNLILLDEAPVYNASHLLGFFSTFNSDALKDAFLYKGNQPANFGGRLASVMDVRMSEGNNQRYNVGGGLGLISSRLSVEGPIVKDKSSFLITGRRTYADVFLKLTDRFKDNKLYFYDLNTKLNYKLGKKDKIYLSGYFGRDVLGLGKTFGIDWGNATGTARWNHIYSSKLFSNTSFIYSSFDYKFKIKTDDVEFSIKSKIEDINVKHEFQYYLSQRHKFKFGLNAILHGIVTGQVEANAAAGFNVKKLTPNKTLENAVFFLDEWSVNENFNVNIGVRGSSLSVMGNGDEMYTYDSEGTVNSTTVYKNNEFLKTYAFIEPRVSFSWQLVPGMSVKGAYSRNIQNIQQVSSSTASSPTDVWLTTSLNTKPAISDQVALGWFKNLKDNAYEINVETYYKAMQNQLDFKNGANSQANEKLEGELLSGIGRAYGLEVLVKKKSGDFTGWVSYTLSKTERKIDGINDNKWYNARQDRTHDLSVVAMYDINKQLSVSALFIFYTGNAITFPSGKYQYNGETYFVYTERNGYRMPNYHRLDFGLTWYRKNTEKFESSWTVSIYNVYARENAYSIDFRENADDPNKTEAVQTTLFKLVPAITYNFKFK